jgi:hypothetical protein
MNSPASSAATARTPDHAASSASASAIRSRRSRRGEAWWSSPRGRGSAVARSRPTTARSRTGPTTRRRAYALPPSNFPHARDSLAGGSERLLCAAESRSGLARPRAEDVRYLAGLAGSHAQREGSFSTGNRMGAGARYRLRTSCPHGRCAGSDARSVRRRAGRVGAWARATLRRRARAPSLPARRRAAGCGAADGGISGRRAVRR